MKELQGISLKKNSGSPEKIQSGDIQNDNDEEIASDNQAQPEVDSLKKPKYPIIQFEELEKPSVKDQIKNRKPEEETQFDSFISGTSATLIVQINREPKRIYVAWVGDSKFIIGSEIWNLK